MGTPQYGGQQRRCHRYRSRGLCWGRGAGAV